MDDIFIIWTGTLDELNKIIARKNQVHPPIKFDLNYSGNSINFLDTTVKKSSARELSTTLFKKETYCQVYHHRKSIPRVFKTQYPICPRPTSKTDMHQRMRFQSK